MRVGSIEKSRFSRIECINVYVRARGSLRDAIKWNFASQWFDWKKILEISSRRAPLTRVLSNQAYNRHLWNKSLVLSPKAARVYIYFHISAVGNIQSSDQKVRGPIIVQAARPFTQTFFGTFENTMCTNLLVTLLWSSFEAWGTKKLFSFHSLNAHRVSPSLAAPVPPQVASAADKILRLDVFSPTVSNCCMRHHTPKTCFVTAPLFSLYTRTAKVMCATRDDASQELTLSFSSSRDKTRE